MKTLHYGRVTAAVAMLLLLGITTFLCVVPFVKAEPLDTYHSGWHLVRETAVEDATDFATTYALATSEGDYANKNTATVLNGGAFHIPSRSDYGGQGTSQGSKWMFAFSAGPTENDTLAYTVLGWAKDNGMAQVLCAGTATLGTQDVVLYPDDSAAATNIWWIDTIVVTSSTLWPKQQGNLAGVAEYNSGNNEVALLVIETMGLEWIQFVLHDCDGTGTEMTNVTVFGRPY